MNKLIIKYIGVFFLFLILVLGCMGFIIYDKLMIEYEKCIKEVTMWYSRNLENLDNIDETSNYFSRIKGLDRVQQDYAGQEIERANKLGDVNEVFSEIFTNKAKSDDLIQKELDLYKVNEYEDAITKQLGRITELQSAVFRSGTFDKKLDALIQTDKYTKDMPFGTGDLDKLAPAFGNAIRKQLSEEDFREDLKKRYSKFSQKDIDDTVELYKDVSSIFNQEMNSKLNDISLKNYDAIMRVFNEYEDYFGKNSEEFKSLINPKGVFNRLKGSNGKDRLFISSLLATLPTEDLVGMLKDQGTEGFNAFMTLLDSKPRNINSFNSAISDASKVLGNMGSNVGPSLGKAVELYNRMGLRNLIATNPNIANLSENHRAYKNILDKNGNVIDKEDTGLLINNYDPRAYIELAKFLKVLQNKKATYNKTRRIEDRVE